MKVKSILVKRNGVWVEGKPKTLEDIKDLEGLRVETDYYYSKEQDATMLDMWQKGFDSKEIAEFIGKSQASVFSRLNSIGRKRRISRYSKEEDAKIIFMFNVQKKYVKDIASAIGRPYDSVRHRIEALRKQGQQLQKGIGMQ